MWRTICVELRKAFRSKSFLISVGLGVVVCILQSLWFYKNIFYTNQEGLKEIMTLSTQSPHYGEWYETCLLEGWIGCESYSSYKAFLFFSMPILAVIPYGISLFWELNTGYAAQMIVRCGRKKYILGKSVATFLSGGVAVVIPLLLSLLISACYLPARGIDMLSMQGQLIDRIMWVQLYYDYPCFYALLYSFVIFIYGGLFALISLLCTGWLENQFGLMMFPMMVYCMMNYGIDNLFPKFRRYNPAIFLDPSQPISTNTVAGILTTTIVVLTFEVVVLWLANRKRNYL